MITTFKQILSFPCVLLMVSVLIVQDGPTSSILQHPTAVAVEAGRNVTLSCNIETFTGYCYSVWWFKVQHAEPMLTPLNTMTDKKYLRDGVEKVCSLTIAGLQTSDSATYYCAYIRGSGASIGPGSAVRVKQPSDQTPSMKILVPFEEDEPKVIIVCLVDGVDQAPYWIISGHRQNGTTDVGVSDSSNSTSHFIRNQISVSVETWASGAPCTCVLETENQRLNRTVRGKTGNFRINLVLFLRSLGIFFFSLTAVIIVRISWYLSTKKGLK
ncbi:immunoglobulin lambda-1 light chain-like [Polypterus senegalus]|uniref:immunoglobulin lambda-1 light chain-like n=1 Tax=Polypterus senegalus TaxID=55291 RepID=UPI001963BF69|nr:immunoglobulin lambda-1 light chain-like [Polypterus senegalus]